MIAQAGFDGIDFTDIPVESKVWEHTYQEYAKHICIGSVLRTYHQDNMSIMMAVIT